MKRAAASSTTPPPANRRNATTSRRCHRGSHAGFAWFPMAARRDRSCRVQRCCRCPGWVGRHSSWCLLVAYLSQDKITGVDRWAPARQDTMRPGRAEMQETVVFGRAVAPCFAHRHGTVRRRASRSAWALLLTCSPIRSRGCPQAIVLRSLDGRELRTPSATFARADLHTAGNPRQERRGAPKRRDYLASKLWRSFCGKQRVFF